MKVEARYRGKAKYYPGVISRVRLNGTYDIDYDDGEKEKGVGEELIRIIDDGGGRSSSSGGRGRRSPRRLEVSEKRNTLPSSKLRRCTIKIRLLLKSVYVTKCVCVGLLGAHL